MIGGFQICKIAGIPIRINISLILLIGLFFFLSAREDGLYAGLTTAVVFVAVFVCIAIHELAHSLVTMAFGIKVRGITLWLLGGVAQLDRLPDKPYQELLIAIVGPPVNFAICGIIMIGQWAGSAFSRGNFLQSLDNPLTMIAMINLTIGVFNSIPAFPMDGGRVLRAIIWWSTDFLRATRLTNTISRVLLVLLGILGIFVLKSWMAVLVVIFLWMAGGAEVRAAEARAALERIPVTQAMFTGCPVLSPYDPLRLGQQYFGSGTWCDLPVIYDGRLVGMLRRQDALRADLQLQPDRPTYETMDREFVTIDGTQTLATVAERFQRDRLRDSPVILDNRLVGVISPDSINAYLSQLTGHH